MLSRVRNIQEEREVRHSDTLGFFSEKREELSIGAGVRVGFWVVLTAPTPQHVMTDMLIAPGSSTMVIFLRGMSGTLVRI